MIRPSVSGKQNRCLATTGALRISAITVEMNIVWNRVRNDAAMLSSVSSVQKRSTMPVRITSGNSEM